jgi:hypothetical protein
MLLTFDKPKILKTIGWSAVALGLYLITYGTTYEGGFSSIRPEDDGVLDAEFTIIED